MSGSIPKKHFLHQVWSVFTLGILSQIGQVLLIRELLMTFHGNELTLGLERATQLVIRDFRCKDVSLTCWLNGSG
ncbi:MAG: hypothetical protein ACOC49_00515 [Candidatus Bipolaricaulota bacterium]